MRLFANERIHKGFEDFLERLTRPLYRFTLTLIVCFLSERSIAFRLSFGLLILAVRFILEVKPARFREHIKN